MADRSLVLSNVLCVLVNKYGKTPTKVLKSMLIDFFSAEDIAGAKVCLLNDLKQLNLAQTVPHVPQRRVGEGRLSHEADDLLTLFTFTDEAKLIDLLPKYVASGPDDMPTGRVYEGDLNILMALLRDISNRLQVFESSLAAVSSHVTTLQAQAQAWPSLPVSTQRSQPGVHQTVTCAPGNSSSAAAAVCQPSDLPVRSADLSAVRVSWGATTATSTPNRFAPLESVSDDNDALDQPYTVVQSRRAAKRARRKSSPTDYTEPAMNPPASNRPASSAPAQRQRQRRSAPHLMGKAKVSSGYLGISAARKLRSKLVFCVDNVNTSCTIDEMTSFVSSLSVDVVTCFEAKSRRRRNEDTNSDISDRKAFRVCIYEDQSDRFMNADAWPEHIVISEWFFKSKFQSKSSDETARKQAASSVRIPQTQYRSEQPTGQHVSATDGSTPTRFSDDMEICPEELLSTLCDNVSNVVSGNTDSNETVVEVDLSSCLLSSCVE